MAPVTTRALVLAGGGLAGIAWELGVLHGLAESGVDVAGTAELVIGTSAGSAVAAQITSGESLDASYARQLAPTSTEIDPGVDLEKLQALFAEATADAADPRDAARRIGAMALAAETVTEARRCAVIAARLPSAHWPSRRLLVTAVGVDGKFTVFDSRSGVLLVDAVAASCAVPGVWPPVTIGARRYIDGGVRSGTNADLAAGADVVLILTPALPGLPDPLADELVASKVPVRLVVRADSAAVEAFGANPLDPQTRGPAARAGRALGHAEAERVGRLWNTEPRNTDPGSTDPGSTDPGSTDPGSTDPGSTDPS
jgi:NTE family protein